MNKLILFILLCIFVTGCSNYSDSSNTSHPSNGSNSSTSNKSIDWDINGYVINKKEGHLLVVWNITKMDIKKSSVKEILEKAQPNAAWLSYIESNKFEVGDKVLVKTTGRYNDSYPAQGDAITVELDSTTR